MAATSNDSSKTSTARAPVSMPWTKIVRGTGESELITAPPSPMEPKSADLIETIVASLPAAGEEDGGSENVSGANGNVGKRPTWNAISNGPPHPTPTEVAAVIEPQSWPALSDSTSTLSKSSSDPVKSLSDGVSSVSISEGTETISQKHAGDHRNVNSNLTRATPSRQRSFNKRNAASTSTGSVLPHMQSLLDQSADMQPNRLSPRYHNQRSNVTSQSHNGNEHPRPQRPFRNRNGGTRGEGFHHQNIGGRHDQERGNSDWNSHRNFNTTRDGHLQQQRVIPGPIRPPPPPLPYAQFPPSQMWHYGSPMGYPELGSPLYYVAPPSDIRAVPLPLSAPTLYFPPADPLLLMKIANQIDYYFSEENLIKDTFLRRNMDDQGWVAISLIAGFKKILNLTDNIKLILDAIQTSAIVEVQGDKVRKRNDWKRWIMPPSFQFSSNTTAQVP